MVLDHISLGVTDLDRSMAFYDAVLAPLGYARLWTVADAAGYGISGADEAFAIKFDATGTIIAGDRFHIAFEASSRNAVTNFFEAAKVVGAKCDGQPEMHPMYGQGYFAAFVLDPDGYRVEAVFHENAASPHFQIDHVQLAMPAGREDAARAFYTDVLGLEEVPKPAELAKRAGAWFRSGAVSIHMGVDAAFVPAKKAHPALRCANYDQFLKRLVSHGVHTIDDPLPFEGKRHCYIADPFGNRIELIES